MQADSPGKKLEDVVDKDKLEQVADVTGQDIDALAEKVANLKDQIEADSEKQSNSATEAVEKITEAANVEEQLPEHLKKQFVKMQEVLISIDSYYIKHIENHQDDLEKRLGENIDKGKEADLLVISTKKQAYVVDKKTLKDIEYDLWMEMRSLVRKNYGDIAKGSCRHCHGSALSAFHQSAPNEMLMPVICDCVVKNHNKKIESKLEHKNKMELLHDILDIPKMEGSDTQEESKENDLLVPDEKKIIVP